MATTTTATAQTAPHASQQALLALENICLKVRNCSFASSKSDIDALTWQRTFKNIVTPVSIALSECKGPRRFHYHYKHREDDEQILKPVEPDAFDVLAHACEVALERCRVELVGIDDDRIAKKARALEYALADFLHHAVMPA